MDSNELRRAFGEFFVERGHTQVPSASLIPFDRTVLFTVAGMVPFKRYFLGEEPAPYQRATSIQKCMRAGGKHNDLDQIGQTLRHLTFFEMLGNFSFGDYFKEQAIPYAWELVTSVLGLEPDRLWVTVHTSDDEAAEIWRDSVGVDPGRIQRLEEDNWWQMGDTGPCGPCSEIYYDKGVEYGADGGPAFGSDERFLEIWNLVFMQFDQQSEGDLIPLPKPCIDTGAGLERIVPILQGRPSVFETDLVYPILQEAESLTGRSYGVDHRDDVGLRIIADHSRAMTFLLADGVVPTNEGRGYVLRRIIRRLVLRAQLLGARQQVVERLVTGVIDTMGDAYPELRDRRERILELATREEGRFEQTLAIGAPILNAAIESGEVRGGVAFRLHDTFGVPIELTTEIAQDRGVPVDLEGFQREMTEQRSRSRQAGLGDDEVSEQPTGALWVLESFGKTEFLGYEAEVTVGEIQFVGQEGERVAVYVDRTPFYPEGGGQVGDTGWINAAGFRAKVIDTDQPVQGVIRHWVEVIEGELAVGDSVELVVDAGRRARVRANHTATHLLQWALREVLGDHVAQQGSLVAPDRLRFDFTHWSALSADEIQQVERLIMGEVVSASGVVTQVKDKETAVREGAIAFFGDQYQDVVRVVHAGDHSVELCGGTHVGSLGEIGLFKVISEGSIGANTRRIEAVTQLAALDVVHGLERQLDALERVLPGGREALTERVEALVAKNKTLDAELGNLRQEKLRSISRELAAKRNSSWIIERVDGLNGQELRFVALELRRLEGVEVVVLASVVDHKVALVATAIDPELHPANEVLEPVASAVGGRVGPQRELALSGGREVAKLDQALAELRAGSESAK
ncbi:alanine--tRNA ligase [Ferrimicrobium acidiphilum]|uniref:Alanine--tRNA ligase n=1 Tax=Ferrimicrobium acidiphilum DSM 19497 TaxID=1121877 RepID=A0A0D8FXD1_9ACTN|nr:alanine--tRNA ligase [Ferrimicrobium acidiphilum]KJE77923.1 alanine--tRNA ligase [Ferrimicrobium acidiphilum DSM 19497]